MSYGTKEAVAGIDLAVEHGEIFALLGPNGAGKTTTVEVLEGYRRRSAGQVSVLGSDPQRADSTWRSRVGVVLQTCRVEPEFTTAECIAFYAGFYPRPLSVDHVLDLVGLREQARTRCGRLSGGQQRRLDVALALVGDPELVFLDEPTTGFDPAARRAAWDVIRGLRDLGKTVLLTTHYLDEAEALADRLAVIVDGRIVAAGDPATLADRDRAAATIRFQIPRAAVCSLPAGIRCAVDDHGHVELSAVDPLTVTKQLANWAHDAAVPVDGLEITRPSLEDVYLQLTGEGR